METGQLSGLENLMNNKLFLQYLSGAGGAMSAGQPIGPALNAVTQQNIGAQSQAKLLKTFQGMLGGGTVPTGWKMVRDEKGTKLELPNSALETKEESQGLAVEGSSLPGGSGTDWSNPENLNKLRVLNPFVEGQSGELTGADLAGLGPEDVSRAFAGALGAKELEQRSISDLLDAQYKGMGRQIEIAKLLRESPLEVPGLGKLSFDEWESLDTKTKAYSYYAFNEKQNSRPPLSFNEWSQQADEESIYSIYKLAQSDPAFKDFFFSQKQAGATRITLGEKVEEKKALAGLEGQFFFKDPKWTDVVDKRINSEEVQNRTFSLPEAKRSRAIAEEKVKVIEEKINAGGGTIIDIAWDKDGKTMVWTVKWPSGDTEKIRYGIRS